MPRSEAPAVGTGEARSHDALAHVAREYARDQVAAILGRAPRAEPDPECLRRWFDEWSRAPERENRVRDAWGNWEFSFADSHRMGLLYQPWLDREVLALREGGAAGSGRAEAAWPDGHPFALCLTHDLDFVTLEPTARESFRHVRRDLGLLRAPGLTSDARGAARHACLRGAYRLATLKGLRRRRERGYDEWLALEARFGFRSTFFVFPEHVSAPHPYDCTYAYGDPVRYSGRPMRAGEMIREIDRAGWEIGLHGSYRSAVQPGLLAEQRRQVEALVGHAVTSTRQHWLHYDVDVTPRLQADAGLQADSTLGFNRNIGFRAGTSFPFPCWDAKAGRALELLEVPQHVMDGALFAGNSLGYDVELAVRHVVQLLDAVEAVGGCLTLSWHPNALEYPHYWSTYERVLEEAARRNAWGCSVRDVQESWTKRRVQARPPADPRP